MFKVDNITGGIGELDFFDNVVFVWCLSLIILPEGLGYFISLETLDVSGCLSMTKLLKGLGNLTSLTTSNLSVCLCLRALSKILRNLTSETVVFVWVFERDGITRRLGELHLLGNIEFV